MGPLRTVPDGPKEDFMISIELKDGSKREVKEGLSVLEIAKEISEGLASIDMSG